MKIYIASSFKFVNRVDELSKELEREGHEITVKWWARKYNIPGERGPIKTTDLKVIYEDLNNDDFYSRAETKLSYESDFKGVKDADVFIFVAGDEPKAYNGANIELGIALGDNKPCFSLGVLAKSVLYYPVIRCKNKCELISRLNGEMKKEI